MEEKGDCPHCKFISETFCGDHPIDSNRNYWHMTEVFVYLHDGKDYCNYKNAEKEAAELHIQYRRYV